MVLDSEADVDTVVTLQLALKARKAEGTVECVPLSHFKTRGLTAALLLSRRILSAEVVPPAC